MPSLQLDSAGLSGRIFEQQVLGLPGITLLRGEQMGSRAQSAKVSASKPHRHAIFLSMFTETLKALNSKSQILNPLNPMLRRLQLYEPRLLEVLSSSVRIRAQAKCLGRLMCLGLGRSRLGLLSGVGRKRGRYYRGIVFPYSRLRTTRGFHRIWA